MLVPSMLALRNSVVHSGARRMSTGRWNAFTTDDKIQTLKAYVIMGNIGYGICSGLIDSYSWTAKELKKQDLSGKSKILDLVGGASGHLVLGTIEGWLRGAFFTILSPLVLFTSPIIVTAYVAHRLENKS